MTDLDHLLTLAREARRRAYAPYSNYQVGAALLSTSGKAFAGCNVENASYGLSMCAERVALGNAVAAGERQFVTLVLVTGGQSPAFPCGACRQVLLEFAPDLTVAAFSLSGEKLVMTLRDLLPHAFTFSDLR